MQHNKVREGMCAVNKINFLYTIWGFHLLQLCAAFVGAIRYKSSFRSAALWAFNYYPPALQRYIFLHLLSKRRLVYSINDKRCLFKQLPEELMSPI